MSPELVTFTTCPFFNESFVYASHHGINVPDNCNETRPIKDTDYFYNRQIILLWQNGSLSFSCAKPLTIFVNNMEFSCKKIPIVFFKTLHSFRLKRTDENFIVKGIEQVSLSVNKKDTHFDISFKDHLDFQMLEDNTTYFNEFLPAVEITPTILGGLLITLMVILLLIILLLVLYCCSSSIKTMIQMYLCCNNKEVNTIIKLAYAKVLKVLVYVMVK